MTGAGALVGSGPPALLALQDGSVWRGRGFGALATAAGEACFNTGMTGYQEVLTDPSYYGQIVTMTAPHIGNTGVNPDDDQSERPFVSGFVVRELSGPHSSWRAQGGLDEYLVRHGVPALSGVDTRSLTRHLRSAGAMRAALSTEVLDASDLVDIARDSPSLIGRDITGDVTTAVPYEWTAADLDHRARCGYASGKEASPATAALLKDWRGPRSTVAAIDFGMKRNILDLLVASGFDVTVMPAHTGAKEILQGGFDGVFLSNGPGDPEPVSAGIATVRSLLGRRPIFGICLGHQILALAAGGATYKLPFGHRGANHPVRRLGCERVEITCQNHGFVVDEASLKGTGARLTHVNLNDHTVEGFEMPGLAYSVQYHPEAGPGPHDSRYLFEQFRTLIARFEPAHVSAAG